VKIKTNPDGLHRRTTDRHASVEKCIFGKCLWPWPLTFWPLNLITYLCPQLHWSCKFGEIPVSNL